MPGGLTHPYQSWEVGEARRREVLGVVGQGQGQKPIAGSEEQPNQESE